MDAKSLVDELLRRDQTVAVAESLTGGLLAATFVNVPGVSRVFRGGLVVYATDLKSRLAGVPAALLAQRGPVDADVALALAQGARLRCVADWGIGTTGVAGPDPQHGVAVGTVYLAVVGPAAGDVSAGDPAAGDVASTGGLVEVVRRLEIAGDRAAIRASAVTAALSLLADTVRPV